MKPHSASARQCLVPPSARTWPYDATMQAVSERRSLLSLVCGTRDPLGCPRWFICSQWASALPTLPQSIRAQGVAYLPVNGEPIRVRSALPIGGMIILRRFAIS
jgi:hypothetical protein